jgi:hypothetical protein
METFGKSEPRGFSFSEKIPYIMNASGRKRLGHFYLFKVVDRFPISITEYALVEIGNLHN